MKTLYQIALISLSLLSGSLFAQRESDKGDRYFDKNLFAEAIKCYQLEIKTNSKSVEHAMQKLADCYRITGEFEKAEETYKKILKKKSKDPKNYLNYGQSLKSSAKYEEASVQFRQYMKLNPSDPMGKIYLQSCDSAQNWLNETIGKEVRNVDKINSPLSDFSPVFYGPNELVFSSSRIGSKEALISFNGGMDMHRLDLYSVEINSIDEKSKTEVTNLTAINTPMHEGPATFTKDGRELYFTRTVTGKKDKKTNKVLNTLQVFYCHKDSSGDWSTPVSAFSFNSQEYSVGQPSISSNGKTIYFMSDMPGGYGGTDIYSSSKQEDDKWSNPVNLGSDVNTFGHELFPYIAENGKLYFSSDTHPGMGQLDIFSSQWLNNKWTNVTNLKPPINSIANDFGIALDGKAMRGFFSSDRFNGKGAEDIYSFSEITTLKITLNGSTIQFPDKSIFDGIKYKLVNETNKTESVLEPKDGIYSIPADELKNNILVAKKNGFSYNKIAITVLRDTLGNYLEATIKPSLRSIKVDGNLISKSKRDSLNPLGIPMENISVSLVHSNATIEKTTTIKNGFYRFKQDLAANESFTVIAKVKIVKDPPDPIISFKGVVTHKNFPLLGATVQLSENGKLIESMSTDARGGFSFNLDPSKSYTVVASKTGYNSFTKSFLTSPSDVKLGLKMILPLDSLGSIRLTGLVNDQVGVVKNAQIMIRSGKVLIGETKSDEEGKFYLPLLPENEYTLTATASGYLQEEVNISTKNVPKSTLLTTKIKLDSIKID